MRPYLEECAQREAEARRAAQAQLDELDAWLEETRRRGDELRAVLEARQPAKPATRLTIDESGAGGLRWVVRVDDRGRTVEELGLLGAPVAARSMEQLGRSYLDVDIRAGTSYIVRRSPGGAVIEELGPLETG